MAEIEILYFAWVREQVGVDAERVVLPAEVRDVGGVIDWLRGRSAAHAEALADPARLRAALEGRFVGPDASIGGARELAIFPPVTGG